VTPFLTIRRNRIKIWDNDGCWIAEREDNFYNDAFRCTFAISKLNSNQLGQWRNCS